MKFSYNWIRDMVPGLDEQPEELQRLITMKTAECEGIERTGECFAHVLAVKVVDATAIGKGRNKQVEIEEADGKRHTIVCGAPNVRPGMLAAWIPPGTLIDGRAIEKATIDGVESEGMLASASELCISRDHSGLLELDAVRPSIHLGERLPGLDADAIIEIDNKSLTHRPDLWGHLGMAREVAAITHRPLHDPVVLENLPHAQPGIQVEVVDSELCPRYSALVVENIKVAPSPLWLQARLESVGINPINNIVDVTNFVMAELPQPMHAFDADKLAGDTIFVRRARSGENIEALNDETYVLTEADLVITDAIGAIAIAGVIGGEASAISETTTRIVLESANFQAACVRLTSSRLKLRTDASMRFEKSLDPENTTRGLARAVALLKDVCPECRVVGGVADMRKQQQQPAHVLLPVEFVVRKLGWPVSREEVVRILRSLGFRVDEADQQALTVVVPSWRATKDISMKDDLVEEIGRIIGYGEITPTPPLVAAIVPPASPLRLYLRNVRQEMASQSFTEVYNYSFVTAEDVERFGFLAAEHLAVENPIASDLSLLRRSLLPGLFKNVVDNTRHFRECRLFEVGREIHATPDHEPPVEKTHLAAAIYSVHADEQEFFDLKRTMECVLPSARLNPVPPENLRPFEHPTRTADIWWRGSIVGRFFEVHPLLMQEAGIEGRTMMFDCDLEICLELSVQQMRYMSPRRYPTSGFDLSVLAERHVPVADIQDQLTALAAADLASIEFVRQYAGPPLHDRQKSVSYHLEVGALNHTLTSDEAATIRTRIIDGMQQHGYELRV